MHRATKRFWDCFHALPENVQALARKNYELLRREPRHPSLHLKRVSGLWTVRVGRNHRAIATDDESGFIWVWVGTHDEYDRLIKSRKS